MQEDIITPIVPAAILEDKPQRKILLAIFMEVFLGFFKNIFMSVFGFFKRYVMLIWFYLKFIIKPDASDHELHREKALDNSRHTFELIVILTAIIIFLIKQGVLESSSTENADMLQNDVQQWLFELGFFIAYAMCYFLVLCLLVLLGRLLRKIFSPIQPNVVMDLVFIHLNNIFFLTAAICSFIVRFSTKASDYDLNDAYDTQHYAIQLFNSFGIAFGIITLVFFIRLTMLHKISFIKKVFYIIIIPAIVWTFLFFTEVVISSMMSNI